MPERSTPRPRPGCIGMQMSWSACSSQGRGIVYGTSARATRRAHEVAKRASHWVGGGSGAKRAAGIVCVWRTARRVLLPGARERRQQQRVLIRGRAARTSQQKRLDRAQGARVQERRKEPPLLPTAARSCCPGCAPNFDILRSRVPIFQSFLFFCLLRQLIFCNNFGLLANCTYTKTNTGVNAPR